MNLVITDLRKKQEVNSKNKKNKYLFIVSLLLII